MVTNDVDKFISDIFAQCDIDKNGFLTRDEFDKLYRIPELEKLIRCLPEMQDINSGLLKRIQTVRLIGGMSDNELDTYFNMKLISDVKEQFGTGDVLLFRGTEGFSKLIKISSICNFSHVMSLVVNPSKKIREVYGLKDESETIFVFEADSEIESHEGGGVQLMELTKWIHATAHYYNNDYNTLLCWRKLVGVDESKRKNEIEEYILSMAGKLYEKDMQELAVSVMGWNRKEDFDTVFCSELVAGFMMKGLDVLDTTRKANNYVPRDFTSSNTLMGHDLVLKNQTKLEREVRLRHEVPKKKLDDKIKE